MGLAVSGGPDSLALLALAHNAFPGRIAVASVDHGIRPESAAECAMVRQICEDIGVPASVLTVTLGEGNLQAEAREARYLALANWAHEERLGAVATAHHADDQAETVLMRLNRGSGLSGLSGIRPVRQLEPADCQLVRPLLGWRKAELEAIVAGIGWKPVRDPSNADERFDRARLRERLSDVAWLDAEALTRSADHLREVEDDILQRCAEEILVNVESAGMRTTYRPEASRYIRKRVVQMLFAERGRTVSLAKVDDLVRSLEASERSNLAGVDARVEDGAWVFEPETPRRTG